MNQHVNNVTYIGWVLEVSRSLTSVVDFDVLKRYSSPFSQSKLVDSYHLSTPFILALAHDPLHCQNLGLDIPKEKYPPHVGPTSGLTFASFSTCQSIPQEIIDTHELQTITLDYRRECQHDDAVDSLTSLEFGDMDSIRGPHQPSESSQNGKPPPPPQDCCQFLHFLKLSGSGLEINRGRTQWRRLAK